MEAQHEDVIFLLEKRILSLEETRTIGLENEYYIASYFDQKQYVKVIYHNPKINIYVFQAIEFPMDDLSKRIDL